MESSKVAIVGAGQLGGLLAGRMPGGYRKVIISRRKAQAVALADEVGGVASDQLSAARGCGLILLAVPAAAANGTIQELTSHLDDGALVVNMAAEIMTDELAATYPRLRFAAAKLLGHAQEIRLGSPGVVVLDHLDAEEEERLQHLFAGLGEVVRGQEASVLEANAILAEVLARAEQELRARLSQLGLDPRLVQAAISATGPGVFRALAKGSATPLASAMSERIRTG